MNKHGYHYILGTVVRKHKFVGVFFVFVFFLNFVELVLFGRLNRY